MQVSTHCSLLKPLTCSASLSPSFFIDPKTCRLPCHSPNLIFSKSLSTHLHGLRAKARHHRKVPLVFASSGNNAERWLLQPVGDGDSRHIGFKVPMPAAYEVASSVVTVGRLPDKADMVIPVATVSGLHARIQKKEGGLLITDLDSTNGTYIDDKPLRPGVAATASPGSCITFGDIHLAMFRVSKLENAEVKSESEDSSVKPETDGSTEGSKITS